jgi:hypothetical protein
MRARRGSGRFAMVRALCVINWWDDEQTEPASYVVREDDGSFRAFTIDELAPDLPQIDLGLFLTCNAAVQAIWNLRARNLVARLAASS